MDWKKLAIAGGVLYAAWKFSGNNLIKGAAVSVGAVIVAKQVPLLKDVV